MNNNEIALRLKEDTKYQEFFKNALKKFGSKTPADMSDEEKDKFFTYIENEWNDEDPATDDNDVRDEGCDGSGKMKKKMSEEDRFRAAIRKEIAGALSEIYNKELVSESNIYNFKNMIRGGMINIKLANDAAAQKYAERLGSKWKLVNIGEAIDYLRELQEASKK